MAKLAGVRAKGSGIEIRYQVGGKRRSVSVKKAPTDGNLADAARYRKRLIELAAIGDPERQNATWEDCAQGFITDKDAILKPSTVDAYKSKLLVYWSALGAMQVRAIRLSDLKAELAKVVFRSQKTRREVVAVARGVFEWAIRAELCDANPAALLEVGGWQRPAIDAFTDAERIAILAELSGRHRVFYGLMFETGARTGELIALQWLDVRSDRIRIHQSTYRGAVGSTKTHQVRDVLLTAEAQALLAGHTETRFRKDWVFLSQYGTPYTTDRGLTWGFRTACKRAGVRYRRPYYCRHTFASRALSAGCEPSWVAEQMGDRIETVVRHYAKWLGGDRDRAQLGKFERSGESVGPEKTKNA